MSTFADLNTIIEQKLATTSEIFFTTEMKRQNANDTIKEICQEYDIPEFIRKPSTTGQITFVGGKVAKPADYFRMVKLWDIDATSGLQNKEYQYQDPSEFDSIGATEGNYWTEDYDPTDDTRKLFIKPDTTTTAYMRYMKPPTVMADDVTESGLSDVWDEAIALGTIMRCYQNAKMYNDAVQAQGFYRVKKAEVYMSVKNPGGVKGNVRLKSKYERTNLFS